MNPSFADGQVLLEPLDHLGLHLGQVLVAVVLVEYAADYGVTRSLHSLSS
jgi:hypothetical protein